MFFDFQLNTENLNNNLQAIVAKQLLNSNVLNLQGILGLPFGTIIEQGVVDHVEIEYVKILKRSRADTIFRNRLRSQINVPPIKRADSDSIINLDPIEVSGDEFYLEIYLGVFISRASDLQTGNFDALPPEKLYRGLGAKIKLQLQQPNIDDGNIFLSVNETKIELYLFLSPALSIRSGIQLTNEFIDGLNDLTEEEKGNAKATIETITSKEIPITRIPLPFGSIVDLFDSLSLSDEEDIKIWNVQIKDVPNSTEPVKSYINFRIQVEPSNLTQPPESPLLFEWNGYWMDYFSNTESVTDKNQGNNWSLFAPYQLLTNGIRNQVIASIEGGEDDSLRLKGGDITRISWNITNGDAPEYLLSCQPNGRINIDCLFTVTKVDACIFDIDVDVEINLRFTIEYNGGMLRVRLFVSHEIHANLCEAVITVLAIAGGALVGGIIFGPIGAIIGGFVGMFTGLIGSIVGIRSVPIDYPDFGPLRAVEGTDNEFYLDVPIDSSFSVGSFGFFDITNMLTCTDGFGFMGNNRFGRLGVYILGNHNWYNPMRWAWTGNCQSPKYGGEIDIEWDFIAKTSGVRHVKLNEWEVRLLESNVEFPSDFNQALTSTNDLIHKVRLSISLGFDQTQHLKEMIPLVAAPFVRFIVQTNYGARVLTFDFELDRFDDDLLQQQGKLKTIVCEGLKLDRNRKVLSMMRFRNEPRPNPVAIEILEKWTIIPANKRSRVQFYKSGKDANSKAIQIIKPKKAASPYYGSSLLIDSVDSSEFSFNFSNIQVKDSDKYTVEKVLYSVNSTLNFNEKVVAYEMVGFNESKLMLVITEKNVLLYDVSFQCVPLLQAKHRTTGFSNIIPSKDSFIIYGTNGIAIIHKKSYRFRHVETSEAFEISNHPQGFIAIVSSGIKVYSKSLTKVTQLYNGKISDFTYASKIASFMSNGKSIDFDLTDLFNPKSISKKKQTPGFKNQKSELESYNSKGENIIIKEYYSLKTSIFSYTNVLQIAKKLSVESI